MDHLLCARHVGHKGNKAGSGHPVSHLEREEGRRRERKREKRKSGKEGRKAEEGIRDR